MIIERKVSSRITMIAGYLPGGSRFFVFRGDDVLPRPLMSSEAGSSDGPNRAGNAQRLAIHGVIARRRRVTGASRQACFRLPGSQCRLVRWRDFGFPLYHF